jgi:RNA polymerase sigma-70 factor, ECF subfamily
MGTRAYVAHVAHAASAVRVASAARVAHAAIRGYVPYPNRASVRIAPVVPSAPVIPLPLAMPLGFGAEPSVATSRAPEADRALTRRVGIGQSPSWGRASSMGQPGERGDGGELMTRAALPQAPEVTASLSSDVPVVAVGPAASVAPVAPVAPAAGASVGSPADTRPIDQAMERYATGEDRALDELYRLAAPRVRAFLARLCADLTLADDLTQDAFLRVHAARGTFANGAPALPWMFAIARNSYRDFLRREQVRRAHRSEMALTLDAQRTHQPENAGDRSAMARQMLGLVQQTLMTLPVRQREAFVLMRFEGLSLAEAAVVLGATQAAVKILVHRAYVVLRDAIERREP